MAQSYEEHYSKQKPCDGKKLRELILAKGISLADAGEMIGLSRSGLTNPCSRGLISPHIIILVDKVLGIPFSDYKIKEPEPEPEPRAETAKDQDGDKKIYKMCASATYSAIQGYCNKYLKDMIKEAVTESLREFTQRGGQK